MRDEGRVGIAERRRRAGIERHFASSVDHRVFGFFNILGTSMERMNGQSIQPERFGCHEQHLDGGCGVNRGMVVWIM